MRYAVIDIAVIYRDIQLDTTYNMRRYGDINFVALPELRTPLSIGANICKMVLL